jgi:iron complex outermembrane receptor protein
MKNTRKPQFKILAGLISSAMLLYPAAASTQDEGNNLDDSSAIEEIIVTGIRGSQMRALDAKRESSSIMDAVAAEDLGKFPDQNISEALQRVPGVTIARKDGEGQFITVRGMGPEHNTVLLNGRVLATENDGREFSFDIIAAESIVGAEIFKTPTASMLEGGIGSTVNLKTARPLDYSGFKAAASVKGLYDDASEETTPQFTGFFSNTFNDGQFGILGSFTYHEREFRTERAYTDGYEANRDLDFDNDGTPELTGVSFPSYYTQDVDESTRKRVGGTLALQWAASENLVLTLDGLYSELDVDSSTRAIAWSVGPDLVTDATVNANNTVDYFMTAPGARPTEFVTFSRPRFAETRQIGFNAEWYPSDQLTVVFDVSDSEATDTITGEQTYFVGDFENLDRELIFNKDSGDVLLTYSNIGDLTDLSLIRPSWFTLEGRDITDEASQATVDAEYAFSDMGILTSVQAGMSFTDREKSKDVAKTPGNIQCIYCSWTGHEYDGFMPTSISSTFDASGFLSGETGGSIQGWPTWDEAGLMAFMMSPEGLAGIRDPDLRDQAIADLAANGGVGVQPVPGTSGSIEEETFGAFIQVNFEGDIGSRPWSGNLGVRYAQTDTLSRGTAQTILSLDPVPNSNEVIVTFSEPVPVHEKGSYDIWLPTSNFRLDVSDDVVWRVAVGKTITRPTLSHLLLDIDYNVRPTERNVRSGNPGLRPMLAWNYDTSLSWYIDEVSYISVALFYKDLTDKWERQTEIIQIQGFDFFSNTPVNLSSGDVTGFELAVQYSFSQLPAPFDGLGFQANYTDVTQKTDGEELDQESTSYNLIAFYEKGPVQARIAYSYRDGYTASLAANRGQPKMIGDYGQWDASASYDITDRLTVFAEALNLSNERSFEFSIFEERLIELKDTGRRYSIGARMVF